MLSSMARSRVAVVSAVGAGLLGTLGQGGADIVVAMTHQDLDADIRMARLDAPLDSRTVSVRTGESALGNLVADALRSYFNADIGLVSGAGR